MFISNIENVCKNTWFYLVVIWNQPNQMFFAYLKITSCKLIHQARQLIWNLFAIILLTFFIQSAIVMSKYREYYKNTNRDAICHKAHQIVRNYIPNYAVFCDVSACHGAFFSHHKYLQSKLIISSNIPILHCYCVDYQLVNDSDSA